ncbi:MAG: Inner membrane protein YrbG [bacterium ADurb.Bin400]|nr:MAG: Inner membrane protein YrbG [bacterium ADurb.Bin400]
MIEVVIKLFLAMGVLLWSGGALAAALSRLSKSLHVSHYIIAFILMAATTTIPELFVSMMSSFDGQSSLALGTVIGSNIANIALIVGVLLVVNRKMSIEGSVKQGDMIYTALIAFFPFLLLVDGSLSRIDGLMMLTAFGLMFSKMIRDARFFTKIQRTTKDFDFWYDIGVFIGSVLLLLVASRYVVTYSEQLAVSLLIPLSVVGILVVALGTSLPEIVFAYKSSQSHMPEMSLGNITGSLIFNASVVLGIAVLISPVSVPINHYIVPALFTLLLLLYMVVSAHNSNMLTKRWGFVLIALYIVFSITALG